MIHVAGRVIKIFAYSRDMNAREGRLRPWGGEGGEGSIGTLRKRALSLSLSLIAWTIIFFLNP